MSTVKRITNVLGWIILITLVGTCAGIALWNTEDANSQPQQTGVVSCFIGHIMARDTSSEHPTFMIKAMGAPEVHHDSVMVPVAPLALVCAKFSADGTSTKPSSSALKIAPA